MPDALDPLQVPGPGGGSSFLGLWQAPPPSTAGTVPGIPGMEWQLDRNTGTLGFYVREPDGSRSPVRGLDLRGDRLVAPNGQAVGRTHADGGFELDRGFAAELAMCPLPGGLSPMPPLVTAPPGAPRAQADALGRAISPRATVPPPGDCMPEEWRRLQADVNRACKSVPRTCNRAMSVPDLQTNLQRNIRCGEARDRINSQCFAGGDRTHRDVSIEAWRAVAACTTELHRVWPPP